ncbi:MAG: HAD hydrolase family protein, partial [Bacillota bacterium]
KLAKKHGIKREEIICIGDSLNDAPMIAYAGLGAVVANGSDAAKAYADIIVPSCQDDGVAYTIRKYGLGEDI